MYIKKLNGYRATHKNKWLLVQNKCLTLQELTLLEYYIDIFDFDKAHQTYGCFQVNFKAIANLFRYNSEVTIRNWHKTLFNKGFIKKTSEKRTFKLTNCERYITPGRFDGKAAYYAKLEKNRSFDQILQYYVNDFQLNETELQLNEEKLPNLTSNLPSIAIGASKVNEYLSQRPMEYRSNTRTTLTVEDKEWIDKNVHETPTRVDYSQY